LRDKPKKDSRLAVARGVATEERGDLVAIAADGHRAPAAAMRAGIIVEEKAAGRVGTATNGRARTFDEEFGSGASWGGEEPVEATFAGDKLEGPGTVTGYEFVVALGDAQDFVYRFDPGSRERLLVNNRGENSAQRFAKAEDTQEYRVNGLRFSGEKGTEACGTILRHQARINKKRDEFVPREIVGGGSEVGEIEGEPAGD
jgi:hypothetical protein